MTYLYIVERKCYTDSNKIKDLFWNTDVIIVHDNLDSAIKEYFSWKSTYSNDPNSILYFENCVRIKKIIANIASESEILKLSFIKQKVNEKV